MKEGNITYEKAYQFLTDEKREYILSKQFVRCGTSIGANVAEANGAISTADFSAKISIAYKDTILHFKENTNRALNMYH